MSGSAAPGLVARVIEACARRRGLTLVTVFALALWGLRSMFALPLDAVPDLADSQVIVLAEWPGHAPQLLEDHVARPLSAALIATPGARDVRSHAVFGMAFISVIFDDGTDIYWARARVSEELRSVRLPEGVTPLLGPDASSVGWVYMYALADRSGRLDLQELRAYQDNHLRYALGSLDGVAEVAPLGGILKQYEVSLNPLRLAAHGVSHQDVVEALEASSSDVGAGVLEIAGHEHVVSGRGSLRSIADIEATLLAARPGEAPLRLADVATVSTAPAVQRGVAELDGLGEVAGGIVVMRAGENALAVIDAVKARIAELAPSFPPGLELVPAYDRSELIRGSIATLERTLIETVVVVSLVILVFLLHARSALVPILSLPLAVLVTFVPMAYQDLSLDIMSLGGIALAIGAMVDASIVIVENVHKRLEGIAPGDPDRRRIALAAMVEVGPTIFFSLLVITVAFIPVFSLEAMEGRLFRPLAFTKTYAMAAAALLAITLTPAVAGLAVRGRLRREDENPLARGLTRVYAPLVGWVVDRRRLVIALAILACALSVPLWLTLGREFMPPLNEGSILYMPSAPPGMAVAEARRVLQLMDRELKAVPEVKRVLGKAGRAETATDPAPLSMMEITITLKPRSAWRAGLDWEELVAELDSKLRYPGMPNVWWMPIQTRLEMLATGVRSPLGLKVLGHDLSAIEETGVAVARALREVPGTRSASAERFGDGFFVDVRIDRARAARHGLRVDDVNGALEAAIGGVEVGEVIEGRARYPIVVRYARELRDEPEALGRVLVPAPSGAQVPLAQLAAIEFVKGPAEIRSENGLLAGIVLIDPGSRPIGDYVAEARQVLAERVVLPPGLRLEWTGQYRAYERAVKRLELVVPLTLALVIALLYLNTGSAAETGIVLLAVPFSLIGALALMAALGHNLSIAAGVGLVALAGLDAETGVMMLLYLKLARRERLERGALNDLADLRAAIVDGAARRLRPKLMTVLTTMLGLMPLLWSDGPGADVMKRIAAPMVGGLATSFLLELLVYPAVYAAWQGRALARAGRESGALSSPG